jgi:Tfp pilus assembly protein PilO
MKSSTYRILSILGSVFLFAGTIFVYSNFVKPAYQEIRVLQDRKYGFEEELKKQQESMATVKLLSEKYKSLTDLRGELSMVLPMKEESPEIINQFQNIAEASRVVIDSLSFQYLPMKPAPADSVEKALGTIRATMRVTGSYNNFKSFAESIQNNVRVMDVNSIKIEGGGISGREALTYGLIIDAYYQ